MSIHLDQIRAQNGAQHAEMLARAAGDPVATAVLTLHGPGLASHPWECVGCDPGEYAFSCADWPCSTVRLVTSTPTPMPAAARDARAQLEAARANAALLHSREHETSNAAADRAEGYWRRQNPGLAALLDHTAATPTPTAPLDPKDTPC